MVLRRRQAGLSDPFNDASRDSPASTAHIAIDVQREFSDPHYSWRGNFTTSYIAGNIAKLTDAFRAAGIRNYVVYSDRGRLGPDEAYGGLHKISPALPDRLVPKTANSAFSNPDLDGQLRAEGIENLILTGFNLSACVRETALDAAELGFNVILLRDYSADDNAHELDEAAVESSLSALRQKGVHVVTAARLLPFLLQNPQPEA